MFDAIEKVIYINLDERVDRKSQVQRELLRAFPAAKIQRFSAIKHEVGGIGCTMSHIAVLELAKASGWKNVLIVEDDFMWTRLDPMVLPNLLENPYDAIVLSGAWIQCDPATYKLRSCQTTTAYIVHGAYYDTILANFKEGLQQLQATGLYGSYALDQYWKRLHAADNWFIVQPIMGVQRPGFSDIEKRVVNYVSQFR